MWALSNQTSYGVDRNWIRDKTGAHRWVVAVKADTHRRRVEPQVRIGPARRQAACDRRTGSRRSLGAGRQAGEEGRGSLKLPGVEKVLVVHGERGFYDHADSVCAPPDSV